MRLRLLPLHAPMSTAEVAVWGQVNIVRVRAACTSGSLRSVTINGETSLGPKRRIFVAWARDWLMRGTPTSLESGPVASESSDLDLEERARAILSGEDVDD